MRLANKVAIVTGAGSGFGEGIARRFAEEGAAVVVADIDAAAADRVAGAIQASGGRARAATADVSRGDQVKAMVAAAEQAFGGLDILVNNAGVPQRNGPMLDVDEAAFDRIFAVNVKSIYFAAIHGVPAMRRRGGGAIINTASTAGLRPRPGLTWYNGSKGAAITLTKSMAVELAPDRIRVNALCPVAGETPMLKEFMGGKETAEQHQRFVSSIPLGRLSQPRDIANAALYLASDEADFITGVALEVDGGRCV
jgi:3-oxoacyl-[acyl-carrier protein] reductase